jgi:hypothetical protein
MILTIARNNNFTVKFITNMKTQMQHKTHMKTAKEENNNKKWATFTFCSLKIRQLINLFRQTYASHSKAQTLYSIGLSRRSQMKTEYNMSGIYKLSCRTCERSYIGQTSRNLTQTYREHIRYIKNNNPQSAYAQHKRNLHEYGTLADTMTLLKPVNRTQMFTPYEQLFIQTFHHNDRLVAEQGTN